MKKTFIVFLLFTSCSISFSQSLDYAKSIVQKLASPEFKGRGYVDNGDKIAAEFIVGEFKKNQLGPVTKTGFYQEFSFPVNIFPNAVSVKLGHEPLQLGVEYLVDPTCPSVNGKFKIVKTSRSNLDTEDKLVGLIRDSSDAFILIDGSEKSKETKEQSKKIDEYVQFLKYSDQISAKGIIIYSPDKLTWSTSSFQNVRPVILIKKDLALSEIKELDITVESKLIKKYQTQNIIGQIKGKANSDSTIVITAHYDHLGKLGKDVYFPGANDNASGVAMLLNLAKYYAANPPKYNTIFIAFSGEEIGLLGSKFFTENPLIDLKKIKFLINFDLAGTGEEGIRIVNGSIYKDHFNQVVKINQEFNLLVKVDIRGEACNSDHCLFHQKGVPCFYIYTQGGIQAYHDVFDKSETLPLTEFVDYYSLMIKFLGTL